MVFDEMRQMLEAEVDDPARRQEMLQVEEEVRSYYQSFPSQAFKEELKTRLLAEAQKRQFCSESRFPRFSRYWWLAGTAAVILLFLVGVGSGLWDLISRNRSFISSWPDGMQTAVPDDSMNLRDSRSSGVLSTSEITDNSGASIGSGDSEVSIVSGPLKSLPSSPSGGEGLPSGTARLAQENEEASKIEGPVQEGLLGSVVTGKQLPLTATIYIEEPQELSPTEILALAAHFGFTEKDRVQKYTFHKEGREFSIVPGEFFVTARYQNDSSRDGMATADNVEANRNDEPVFTPEAAEKWMRDMIREMNSISGGEFSAPQIDKKNGEVEVISYPLVNGLRFIDNPISARFDLKRGELTDFTAVLSSLKPWKNSFVLAPEEAIALQNISLSAALHSMEPVMQRRMQASRGEMVRGRENSKQFAFVVPAYWFKTIDGTTGKKIDFVVAAVPPGEF